ncbi:MAG: alkaline phosphatase family protein [Planctomycetota bacterium]
MSQDEGFVIQILWGFGATETKWDGLLSATNAHITKITPVRFDADRNEDLNEKELSWTSTTPPQDPGWEQKFRGMLRQGTKEALEDAWNYADKQKPRGLVVHLDAGPTATISLNSVAGRWTFSVGELQQKGTLTRPVGSAGARFEASLLRPYQTTTRKTENVIVVVLSGLRYSEAFGDREAHFMPRLCEELRQLGTTYENFYNDHLTETYPAHCAIVTGAWVDHLPSNGSLRPDKPTIFERHKAIGNGASPIAHDPGRAVLVCGQGQIAGIGYSSAQEPYCGAEFGATLHAPWHLENFPSEEARQAVMRNPALCSTSDAVTWNTMKRIMRDVSPSLLFVSFGEMDALAHTGQWWRYARAVRKLDEICWMIWREIQVSPFYKDRTTLMITTDHGRHDLYHGGFAGHGCYCEGCQHCVFLAIGPDIRPNHSVVTERWTLIDIAPTIADLLGFEMPYADGSVMREMLKVSNNHRTA